jgi:glycosyltransferase involved in cell wall biosynthesis
MGNTVRRLLCYTPSSWAALTESVLSADAKVAAMRDQLTVVIPTLNEGASIGHLLDEVKAQGFDKIIVVDGYSKDGTAEIAARLGAEVMMQHGHGKAGAILTAFRSVSTPYLIVMDGDGSYDPADINRFFPLAGEFDFVKGVRARNGNMSELHKFGNWVITKTFDLLFGTSIGDVCSGMYMLRTEKAKRLHLEKHPFTVEQEIAAEAVVSSGRVTTIPINYRERSGGTSKVKTWRQGFRDLLTNFDLARTYNPVLLFSTLAALVLLPAIGLLIYALVLNYAFRDYHSGYFLGSAILFVLGTQGLVVSTVAAMLRRIERKLDSPTSR